MSASAPVSPAPEVAPFVDGRVVCSSGEALIEAVDPSSGRVSYRFTEASVDDVDAAVVAARRAFEQGWEREGPLARKRILHRFAELIERDAAQLDTLDAGDMGKPVSVRMANAQMAADLVHFYAECVDKVLGDSYPADAHAMAWQRRVPRGVIGAVTPWNFPTVNAIRKLAPALAAGNAVVLKPSELSSRSAMRLAMLAIEAGLPPGVLNVVPGSGRTVGAALALHMDVDMLTFTGSTVIGKQMMQYSGQSNLKVVMAECGGKSPQIVFDDGIDIETASRAIASLLLTNQGQICTVGSRLVVARSIEVEIIERIKAHVAEIAMGDALDPATDFGPLVSRIQRDRVLDYIGAGHAEGAELVCGGNAVRQESGGFFVEPTIFSNVAPTARIAQEEIFGPVLSVLSFADEDEAVRIANGTAYGLAAYVWSADLSRALRIAKAIRSSVRINTVAPSGEGAGFAYSSEPAGQSGIGVETGMAGMESYMRRQGVWVSHA